MTVVKAGGYDQMTVRSLAAELGVSPMSLYRHIRDKDDLLDEVVDRLLANAWRPRCAKEDWRAWMAEAADRLRRLLVSQPAALHVYLRHPVVSPAAIARMEAMMSVLRRAGAEEQAARRAYAAVHTYTIGFAALESSRVSWAPRGLPPTAWRTSSQPTRRPSSSPKGFGTCLTVSNTRAGGPKWAQGNERRSTWAARPASALAAPEGRAPGLAELRQLGGGPGQLHVVHAQVAGAGLGHRGHRRAGRGGVLRGAQSWPPTSSWGSWPATRSRPPRARATWLARPTMPRWWAVPLVVVLGGLVAGLVVFTFAPEAEGHGTDAAIDAVHHNPRGIRLRAVVVKIVASAVTIGSGGSGGREGPTAQISAGFGSLLARALDLSPEDGRVAVSVGIGSGIGAIFSAPLGGAVLAAEIVYRDDFEYEALLPGVFASIVAYAIFGAVFGYRSLFSIPGGYAFQPEQLAWFALIGVLAGGMGLLYSKSFYGVARLARRPPILATVPPRPGRPAHGPGRPVAPRNTGHGLRMGAKGPLADLDHLSIFVVIALPFARIAATSFSIGTGGSGGVFGPGMVIGAFTGLAVWRLLEPFAPGVGHSPAPFVVVGMMATFGGISRAPIAVMLMVAEMTGSVGLLGPAMVAVAIAWFIVGRTDDSIYRSQLRTRADSAASRLGFGLPLLATLQGGRRGQAAAA